MTAADRAGHPRARLGGLRGAPCACSALRCGETLREEELAFLGIAAMLDPPKRGVKEAVAALPPRRRKYGDDHGRFSRDGACHRKARLGIARGRGEVVTGEELDEMGEEELSRRAERYAVYARVSPGHKQQIVRALQAAGEVVAMTGDGVNDAPALKSADVGVAMGSGTDVTKNAADVVLTDDDFATMVRAVEEGRNVFFNIKKTVSFFLSTNFAEVLSVVLVSLFLWQVGLSHVHAAALGQPDHRLAARRGARRGAHARRHGTPARLGQGDLLPARHLFHARVRRECSPRSCIAQFFVFLHVYGNGVATTAAFLTLSLSELLHVFNVRAEGREKNCATSSPTARCSSPWRWASSLNVMLVLSPALCTAFRLTPLTGVQWLWVALCSAPCCRSGRATACRAPPRRLSRRRTYIPAARKRAMMRAAPRRSPCAARCRAAAAPRCSCCPPCACSPRTAFGGGVPDLLVAADGVPAHDCRPRRSSSRVCRSRAAVPPPGKR